MYQLCVMLLAVIALTSAVDEYNDENFDDKINEHENVLVMFYAPWCGHCKNIKPEYEAAESILIENDPPVKLIKIDCTENGKQTCEKYSISGYPTLKIFKNGNYLRDYKGPRGRNGIIKYMKSQVGPGFEVLEDENALDVFLKEPDVKVVAFLTPSSSLKEYFVDVTKKLSEKFRFALTVNQGLITQYEENSIFLFRPNYLESKFEPNYLKFNQNIQELELWMNENKHSLVHYRNNENHKEFREPLVIAYYKVDFQKDIQMTKYWRNRIFKIAKHFTQDFNFAVSSKFDFEEELNSFGIDNVFAIQKPIVVAKYNSKKYKMSEEFTMENFESFLSKLRNDELEPFIKSEPIPETNDDPVKIAVGNNFNEMVFNSNKDTIIEFYAPWCQHCKELAPTWDKLGELLINEDIDVVKMDATNNDVPSIYQLKGYPSIFWASKSTKLNPTPYEGNRNLDEFIKFVAEHATEELKGYDRTGKAKLGKKLKTEL